MEEQNNIPHAEAQNPASPEAVSLEPQAARGIEPGEPLSPRDEQKRYWERDLFYKKFSLFVSSGGFLLIILGLFANIWSIGINTKQLRLNAAQSEKVEKSIRANVEQSIVTRVIDLDQVFIQKPDLTPYFYEDKPIYENDDKYREVSATAVMVLDVFDLVATQNKHYPEFWDTPEAWDEWMIDFFSTSPILRATFDKYPSWYGNSLKELRNKGQKKLENKVTQKAKP